MSKFYLVAWEGEPLTWSVVSEKFVRGETGATAGEARQARWDDNNYYNCEILTGAGKFTYYSLCALYKCLFRHKEGAL